MTTEQIADRMGLAEGQTAFLAERVALGRCFIVTRPLARAHPHRRRTRVIQGACETQESAERTFQGWRDHKPIMLHVHDGTVTVLKAYHTEK